MSAPETNFEAWLVKAENDFLNIANNLSAAQVPWDTVCFHAQQAAEKLFKAFLVFHRELPPRTHDLVVLLAECTRIEPALAFLEEDCRRLTFFAVSVRYPGDVFDPEEKDGREMAALAERVRAEITARLPGCARG